MNMKFDDGLNGLPADQVEPCPQCGSGRIKTSLEKQDFAYGAGENPTTLSAVTPIRTCLDCNFQYLDEAAEIAHHEAVCQHLGVMPPAKIRSLREQYGLSRSEFARVTRLGEATVARWERGELIQNAAYDSFLLLLGFPENMKRLQDLAGIPEEAKRPLLKPLEPRFRCIRKETTRAVPFDPMNVKAGA